MFRRYKEKKFFCGDKNRDRKKIFLHKEEIENPFNLRNEGKPKKRTKIKIPSLPFLVMMKNQRVASYLQRCIDGVTHQNIRVAKWEKRF